MNEWSGHKVEVNVASVMTAGIEIHKFKYEY